MRSRYFHPEWGYLAPSSAVLRAVGIAVVAMVVGAAAGVCVVVSLIAANGTDTSLSSHHTLITGAPAIRPPASLSAPGLAVPASVNGFPNPEPANLGGSQKPAPAIAVISEPIHVEAGAPIEPAPTKKRVAKSKRHHGRYRWSDDRIRERLGALERLKPQ